MDWLVFNDPSVQRLTSHILSGELRWMAHPAMLDELLHVLGRGVASRYMPDHSGIAGQFRRHCTLVDADPAPAVRLKCRDPDDQVFIDFAVAVEARWLLSRDRAVLALAKRARAQGLSILSPRAWSLQMAAPNSELPA